MSEETPTYGGRYVPKGAEVDALNRLVAIALNDSGQSETVADFLLAWLNAKDMGGFDLARLWSVDTSVVNDMLTVCAFIVRCRSYPDQFGYAEQFRAIVKLWRPAPSP